MTGLNETKSASCRLLEPGEIIQSGDQFQCKIPDIGWVARTPMTWGDAFNPAKHRPTRRVM